LALSILAIADVSSGDLFSDIMIHNFISVNNIHANTFERYQYFLYPIIPGRYGGRHVIDEKKSFFTGAMIMNFLM